MHHFTHSEAVVIRRAVWYCLLMLVIALFAFGMYKATVFLETVIEEPKGSRNPNNPQNKGTYGQYEEVVSIHTPKTIEVQAPPTLPTFLPKNTASKTPRYPIERTLISADGRSIQASLLNRPDESSITLKRLRDGKVFTISLSKLSKADRDFIGQLPVATDS